MRVISIFVAATAMMLSTAAHAEPTAKELLGIVHAGGPNASVMRTYVVGVSSGLLSANSELALDGQKQFYCQPRKLALTGDQVVQILRDYLEENPKLADDIVSPVVMEALKSAFPCP